MTDWQDVEVPQGRFIGWGKIGQTITGRVVTYSDTEGRSFNDEPCPLLVLELTEAATSYRVKEGTSEDLAAGEMVSITCGQANLRRTVRAGDLTPGDLVRIKYDDTYKTASGEGKSFKMQVARGAKPEPVPDPFG
jgi:hypothetical protein